MPDPSLPNRIQIDGRSAFVSDVHLSDQDPITTQRFLSSIAACKGQISSLFVLGDLFDAWIGDDAVDTSAQGILANTVFTLFASLGCPVYFCAGNRDFLLGVASDGAKCQCAHGLHLLDDQTIVRFSGAGSKTFDVLLCHGDEYCIDDTAYQAVRITLRGKAWQTQFLSKSIDERRVQATQMRAQSKQAKDRKPLEIMDVNAVAIDQAFSKYNIPLLIHGHTHRPNQHDYQDPNRTRVVLSDWDGQAQRGNVYFIAQKIIDLYAKAE